MGRALLRLWTSLKPLELWLVFFLGLVVFLALAEDVYEREGFSFDAPLLTLFHQLRRPFWDRWALALTHSASASLIPPVALLAVALGYVLRLPWLRFALGFGGSVLFTFAAKLFFARTRPHLFPQIRPESDFSFPSGHTVASLALVLGLYFLLRSRYPQAAWLLVLGLPWAIMVGLSRVYLQVHYPSDVLAGWALVTAWTLWVWLRGVRRGGG